MSAKKHTPEPWHHHLADSHRSLQSYILSESPTPGQPFTGQVIATETTCPDSKANHARAVECVNAMIDVDKPAVFIDMVRNECSCHPDDCRCFLCSVVFRKG